MARIMFEDSWKHVASASVTSKDTEKDAEKSDTVYKLYHASCSYLLVPEPKFKHANRLCSELLANTNFTSFVILDDLYKTQYGAPTAHNTLTYQS